MINILDLYMNEKIENFSSLTTLTIDIHNALHAWEEFQHHLSIFVEDIIKVCV